MKNRWLEFMGGIAVGVAMLLFAPATFAGTYDLVIGEITLDASGTERTALAINGSVPAPTLRFFEGEELTINVTNTLEVDSSIHWHGLIVPFVMDGVPGISFDGIEPGTTHTYRFPTQQSGTYWYHSHSGLQEQEGLYGAIIIDPREPEPYSYDREYIVVLSDWHDSPAEEILANLVRQPDYYNQRRQTLATFLDDVKGKGFRAALANRLAWAEMRMTPTDIADVSGYTFLVNGKNPAQNWTGLFESGERVRLRFINAAAMTFFDVRIPGLRMTVVQADGNNVQPVVIDEFRIAVAETYDVIVEPEEDRAYTLFAESMARTGFARGTLAPREGLEAAVPPPRDPPFLTMADMGHGEMDHGQMDHSEMQHDDMAGMEHHEGHHEKHHQGHHEGHHDGHHEMPHEDAEAGDPFYAPGSGLTPRAANGGRFLSYKDLKARDPRYPFRPADREIEIRLTGNMERYFWSINEQIYPRTEPIRLRLGERVRFKFVNETMMTHPMHLHGMWTILDVGAGEWNPVKHTVSIAPATTVYAEIEADAPGRWAFHCHLMYHMATGMFREVVVEDDPEVTLAN
ncbi:MAG: copper resistance system multicopper oxidase [Gammaproteobacteria bacterium]|nr:copper resistance system multicopper oxidase [Gammaproteobacteria bacterium]